MTVSTGDILRVVAQWVWDDGEINQNVFNAVVTGAGGPWADADILTDAVAWILLMYNEVVNDMAPEISGSEAFIYKWDPIGLDWDEVGTKTFAFTPLGATDELPRGVAALINAQTTDPDIQGKKYLPAFVEGTSVAGLFSASVVAHLVLFLAKWATDFVGTASLADWDPSIWSPTDVVAVGMTGSGSTPAVPAYQRRRKNNVGI